MTRTRRLLVVALVATATASPVRAKDNWINLTTRDFNIVSNAGEGETRRLAVKLEQFHAIFSKLFNTNVTTQAPVTVMVFKSDDSFKPFKPLYKGKPSNIAGYFQRSEDENIIALNIAAQGEHPMAVVLHEYTHLLTSFVPRAWPAWLSEGLAEVYSTFDIDKNQVIMGKPVSSHVYLLREKFMPVADLLAVDHKSAAYNERDKQGIFYAESWALTHYLMFGNKGARRPELVDFVKRLAAGTDPGTAFAQAFKTDIKTLEKSLRDYVQNNQYPGWIITLDTTEGDKAVASRPLAEAEVQFFLGNLLARTDRPEDAEVYLKQSATLDPNLPRAYEGLGLVAIRRGNFDEAARFFKEAVAHDSRNHLAHYYYASALVRGSTGSMNEETAKRVIALLDNSIKLMPSFAPSHELMAFAVLVSGQDLRKGIVAIKNAIALAPQQKRYVMSLAQLQMRAQDLDGAKQTLGSLLGPDIEDGLRNSAKMMIASIDNYRHPEPPPPLKAAGNSESGGRVIEEQPNHSDPSRPDTTQSPSLTWPSAKSWPTLEIPGAEIIHGKIISIECQGKAWTLVVQSQGAVKRYVAPNIGTVEFYSQSDADDKVGCGPVNKPAFVYYRPATGNGRLAGQLLGLEFTKP